MKWLPPIGTLRIQIFWPLETSSVVLSAPMSSRIVYESIATASSPRRMPNWSKLKKLYSASGAIWISSTSSSRIREGPELVR